jgi:hypothetical protein
MTLVCLDRRFSANITGFQFNETSSYFSIVFGLTLKGTYSPRVPIECDYVENLAEATVRANCTNIDGPSLIGNSDLNVRVIFGLPWCLQAQASS